MIKLNKYLREIGIDEHYWLFEKTEDPRYFEDEEGFKPAEFFDLDTSLSLYIYSHLCYFRDNCLVGHPAFLTYEKWKEYLDAMIEAFKLQIIGDGLSYTEPQHERNITIKNRRKKINYGMRLFIKYYDHLWF